VRQEERDLMLCRQHDGGFCLLSREFFLSAALMNPGGKVEGLRQHDGVSKPPDQAERVLDAREGSIRIAQTP
jgi:hypothetical protein